MGFSKWKINAEVVTFNRADGYPQQGDFKVNYSKKKATILIGINLKLPIEKIVVHELIHIILWPLDQKTISIIKKLPKKQAEKEEYDFLGKLEGVVAQITKSFFK